MDGIETAHTCGARTPTLYVTVNDVATHRTSYGIATLGHATVNRTVTEGDDSLRIGRLFGMSFNAYSMLTGRLRLTK